MSDENTNIPVNEDPKPELTPENIPEVAPSISQPELPVENTPEITPQEVKPEIKPEAEPYIPQPAAPAINTPQQPVAEQYMAPQAKPYTPPYQPVQARPYAPPYQAPNTQAQPYTPPYQTPNPQTQPYTPPYQAPYTQAQPYTQYSAPANPQQYGYIPQPNAPQPKKRSTGANVMLICLWVLLGLFSLATIGTISYYMGQSDSGHKLPYPDNPIIDFFDPTEPEETKPYEDEPAPQATEATDDPELYGEGEIILNNYPANINDTSKYNNQSAFEKVSPSAVGIICYQSEKRESVIGQGTGIIVNTDGYIATNSHVIGDSKTAYIVDVVLSDGKTYAAKVVGFDTRTDLAVIKINAKNLTPAEFADSDLASIGEDVIAVGNPGGIEFQNTLTRGVISAKDRTLGLSTQVKYIQTDAAINPGNSGGPLCNLAGQVIGINSAKIASEEYEGMGFAIPSRTVKEVADDLISQGFVSGRVKIGIMGTAVTETEALYNNVPQGILVSEVIEGGPCDNGKINTGDIVVALDEYEIKSFNDIYIALTNYKEGDEATLKVYRPDTKEYIEVEITLQSDEG